MARRRRIGLAILAFWVVMMGWLVWRHRSLPSVSRAALVGEVDSWLAVELADASPAGFVHLRRLPESQQRIPGARWVVTSRLELSLLGRASELEIDVSAWQPLDGPFSEIELLVKSGDHELLFEGGIRGGALEGVLHSAGEQLPLRFPVGDELLLGGGVGSALTLPALEVGQELVVDAFDATSFSTGKARLRCVKEEEIEVAGVGVMARVVEIEASGLSSRAWVDSEGGILRAETPFGLVLRRISAEAALAFAMPGEPRPGPGSLLESTVIHPKGKPPASGATRLRLRILGIESDRIPSRADQQYLGNQVWQLEAASGVAEVQESLSKAERARYLVSDAFLQVDHPRIQAQAKQILEGVGQEPWQKAIALYDWVFREIDKEVVLSVPSALDVLETREGDCNEHTVLFTALARASGLPTKIAIGLVWSPTYEGFYYHAWPVVWAGRWIKMDPTLGQQLADATHLELLEGGIESWPPLAALSRATSARDSGLGIQARDGLSVISSSAIRVSGLGKRFGEKIAAAGRRRAHLGYRIQFAYERFALAAHDRHPARWGGPSLFPLVD